jgi:Fe-S-cluster containining protein
MVAEGARREAAVFVPSRATRGAVRDRPARRGCVPPVKKRLLILGQLVEFEVLPPDAPARASDLFAMGCAVTERLVRAVTEAAALHGEVPSCGPGCGACCTQLVPISRIEALHLARLVEAMPEGRRRSLRRKFDDAVRRLEKAILLDPREPRGRTTLAVVPHDGESLWDTASRRYHALGLACPFLERGSCTIHAERPLVCREYLVTSPAERCARFTAEVRALPRPVRMSEALAAVADELTGEPVGQLPLVLALEWAEAHGEEFDAEHRPERLVELLLAFVEPE